MTNQSHVQTPKKHYSREQKVEAIKCYHEFKLKIEQVAQGYEGKLNAAASTARYGIEATMPKAQGGTSDPTFNAVVHGDSSYHPKKYVDSMKEAVALVDALYRKLNEAPIKDRMLLDMWCANMTEKEIAKELGVERSVVNRNKERLLKVMGE